MLLAVIILRSFVFSANAIISSQVLLDICDLFILAFEVSMFLSSRVAFNTKDELFFWPFSGSPENRTFACSKEYVTVKHVQEHCGHSWLIILSSIDTQF